MSFATSALRTLALALLVGLSLPLAAQTQAPHGGTPFLVPAQGMVIIEAENFDDGGEGIAYHDNVAGNLGGKYRTGESVDIIDSRDTADPAGFVVNNFETGEWLEYTVNIQAAGQYEIAIRTASGTFTGAFHVEIDRNNVTGTVSVAPTGDFGTFTWVAKRGVSLPAGEHVLRLVSEQQYFDVNQIRVTSTPTTPFAGVIPLPGTFEAENFDNGGEGVAYHDNVAGNAGGQYRTTDVDIVAANDPAGGGYRVNNFETGEWLVYTVSVATAGLYEIDLRAATGTTTSAAFHIEIDGANVTGSVAVPATGSFGTFDWIGRKTVQLAAGQHVLKLVSDQQYIDVNQIRVSPVTHTPFSGTPIALPGTFEAENFDLGGEGNAYHDLTPTNDGGAQFRVNEGVDIKPSPDPDGGTYVINNFQIGEYLVYTVNVAQSGNYDIDLRAATGATTSAAFHIEIDGANVTGSVAVPATGSFGTFDWIGRKTVQLTAGQHVLKLVSDRQYIDVNQIRVVASAARPKPPELLFWSGFEGATALALVTGDSCEGLTNCRQAIVGTDSTTGSSWPPSFVAGEKSFELRRGDKADDQNTLAQTIGQYMFNEIRPGEGRNGSNAMFSKILQSAVSGTNGQGDGTTQMPYLIQPPTEPPTDVPQLYLSYWVKFQSDLVSQMQAGDPWRALFEWKTSCCEEYRITLGVKAFDGPNANWVAAGDNDFTGPGGQNQLFWSCPDDGPAKCGAGTVLIPTPGEWFKVEVFWHRGGESDGRVWMAINGEVVVNRHVDLIRGNPKPINRIFVHQLYTGGRYPAFQWVDDLQIWSDFPRTDPQDPNNNAREGDPWFDNKYGPH